MDKPDDEPQPEKDVEVEVKTHEHPLSWSEKAVNCAKAISLIGALVIACYGAFLKGEPDAALSYKKLAEEFNILKTEVAKERAFLDGFLSGSHQGYGFGFPMGGEVPATQPAAPKKVTKGGDTKVAPVVKVAPAKAPSKVTPPAPAPTMKAPVIKSVIAPPPPAPPAWQQQRLERAPLRDLPTDIETLKRSKR